MDKKNTMLLTVIAVATLLVAVVGATFAFFAVSNPNDEKGATATATAQKPGMVTLENGTSVTATITAENMDKANQGKNIYITKSNGTRVAEEYSADTDKLTFATIKASKGNMESVTYSCTANLKVDTTETDMTLGAETAYLKFDEVAGISAITTSEIDLSDASDWANKQITFTIDGDDDGATQKVITGSVWVVNKASDQSTDLAGKKLQVKVSVTGLDCKVTA